MLDVFIYFFNFVGQCLPVLVAHGINFAFFFLTFPTCVFSVVVAGKIRIYYIKIGRLKILIYLFLNVYSNLKRNQKIVKQKLRIVETPEKLIGFE